jgi:hypothetical protein
MTKELCHGNYSATQHAGRVTVFAVGSHPTTGYKVYFEPVRMQNAYELYHERQDGSVGNIVTHFAVQTSYDHAGDLKSVLVTDATGGHEVPVVAAAELCPAASTAAV